MDLFMFIQSYFYFGTVKLDVHVCYAWIVFELDQNNDAAGRLEKNKKIFFLFLFVADINHCWGQMSLKIRSGILTMHC